MNDQPNLIETEDDTPARRVRPLPEEVRIASNILRELSEVPLASRVAIMQFVAAVCSRED